MAACGHPPVSTAVILSSGKALFLTKNSQSSLKVFIHFENVFFSSENQHRL